MAPPSKPNDGEDDRLETLRKKVDEQRNKVPIEGDGEDAGSSSDDVDEADKLEATIKLAGGIRKKDDPENASMGSKKSGGRRKKKGDVIRELQAIRDKIDDRKVRDEIGLPTTDKGFDKLTIDALEGMIKKGKEIVGDKGGVKFKETVKVHEIPLANGQTLEVPVQDPADEDMEVDPDMVKDMEDNAVDWLFNMLWGVGLITESVAERYEDKLRGNLRGFASDIENNRKKIEPMVRDVYYEHQETIEAIGPTKKLTAYIAMMAGVRLTKNRAMKDKGIEPDASGNSA